MVEVKELLLFALIGALTLAIYFVRKRLHYFKDRGIPYVEPHLLYGNMRGFRSTRILQDMLLDVYKKFKGTGPYCGFYFFQRPMALVLDLDLAKHVLIKDFNKFADRGVFYNERDDPLSAHLFALDGNKWKRLRHKLSPTFTSGKMKFMFPTVVEVGNRFIDVFGDMMKKSENHVVEIKELSARFTTDVIGSCAFGIECNSLHNPDAEFRVMGNAAFTTQRHGTVLSAFIQGSPKLARFLRFGLTSEDVQQFFMRIVRETVAYREQNKIKRSDFMDMLIELKNKKSVGGGDELAGLTIDEVAAQAFVFFLAGFETSSTAMSFTLYELARNQDVQDKLRRHVNEVFARHKNELTYECMKDLDYLEQVFSEALRLYTIVPNLVREANEEYVVPGHPNYVIEKGTGIIIPTSCIHQDADYYPDPERFDPERFAPEEVKKRDSVEWLPFGDGPRNCIGLRFGKMQAFIGLSLLIRNFKFGVCKETAVPLQYDPKSLVLGSKGGIYLRVDKV